MPTFMNSLAANPGNSGIYGQPGAADTDKTLAIVNKMKDREKADFKDKANFMADLSNKQDRIRALYNPQQQQSPGNPQPINNAAAPPIRDPNALTAAQSGELGIKQQQLNQQGRMG